MSSARALRVSDDAVFRELGDEAVVLNLASGMYFGLNAVALRIWQLIDQDGSFESIRDTLVAEFDVDPDTAARDVEHLVEALSARGLVVERS